MSNEKEQAGWVVEDDKIAKSQSLVWLLNLRTTGHKGLLCSSSLALRMLSSAMPWPNC